MQTRHHRPPQDEPGRGRGFAIFEVVLVLLFVAAASSCSEVRALEARPPSDKPHPALVAHMARVQDADFISVVFHLDPAFELQPADQVAVLAGAVGATPRERRRDGRRRLMSALQRKAAETQDHLWATLETGRAAGDVRKVRRLWILNAIGCEARKSFLDQILLDAAALGRVAEEGIRLDLAREVLGGTTSASGAAQVAWGIQKLGADTLSTSGVKGAGTLVAVIDLGFNLYHPDIEDRIWTNLGEDSDGDGMLTPADENGIDEDSNGYIDDLSGWNFADQNGDVSSTNPHGTAVAGIVAGTGQGGTRTGVAPAARLMLLRVGSDVTLTATQSEVWQAMQYASSQSADIVNLSMRWRDDHDPDLASWREEVDFLTGGGVLFVTVAGNDADLVWAPPQSITTPGRVPSALTVGATDQSDVLWFDDSDPALPPIGSNTGPVTWQAVPGFMDYPYPPGLMKPDVVAPGVGITSTYLPQPPNRYQQVSATSFAAPHVSGLAALLLQVDSNLGPYELRYLIEESAVDLPLSGLAPGPDVSHGWGRVDAGAAAALIPIDPTPYDLSITATDHEWTTVDIWVDNDDDGAEDTPIARTVNHLYARVRNLGGQVAGNVQLAFYYADVATIGIGDFDPNGDGDRQDGNFDFIGTYAVPLLGPAGSDHAAAIGSVNWEIPLPTSDHWCVGVSAHVHAPNALESDTSNNRAFRNFFEMLVMTSQSLEFRLAPPPGQEREAFDLVLRRVGVPAEVKLYLRVDNALLPAFAVAASRLGSRVLELPGERGSGYTLFPIEGDATRFVDVHFADGEPIPVSLWVRAPTEIALPRDARVVVSVHGVEDEPVGGLTLQLLRGSPRQRGGPYYPKNRR